MILARDCRFSESVNFAESTKWKILTLSEKSDNIIKLCPERNFEGNFNRGL